jgi:GT2 family glycosyltransferase
VSTPRTLVVLLVNDEGPGAAASVRSAARLSDAAVDVRVLDDSGDLRAGSAGGGDGVADLCRSLGAGYYRSPRPLGAARAMNLALLRGRTGRYEHVLVAAPGAVLPHNAVAGLRAAAGTEPLLASVTAWSNDVSVYSLAALLLDGSGSGSGSASGPGSRSEAGPREGGRVRQDRVDWVSSVMQAEFGSSSVDAPFAVGACCLISVEAIGRVGLFDPAMGVLGAPRADGEGGAGTEELDWGLRARSQGYRTVLAPGVFAYHAARPPSTAILATPPLADRALELRHPGGRPSAEAVLDRTIFGGLRVRAEAAVVREAARARGWSLEASRVARPPASEGTVQFTITPGDHGPTVRGRYLGATMDVALRPAAPSPAGAAGAVAAPAALGVPGAPRSPAAAGSAASAVPGVIGTLHDLIGLPPSTVTIFDRGPQGELLMAEAVGRGVSVLDARSYPETL